LVYIWLILVRFLRDAGAAVLVLGIVCWVARGQAGTPSATIWILVLLCYDIAFILLLLITRFVDHLSGVMLWPGMILHAGLAIWSIWAVRVIKKTHE